VGQVVEESLYLVVLIWVLLQQEQLILVVEEGVVEVMLQQLVELVDQV
jgi:hypothetical protein